MSTDAAAQVLARHWEPLEEAALDRLADRLADARVVGLGVTTREAAEPFAVQTALARALVRRGFGTVVVQDAVDVAARYDAFVAGSDEPLEDALADAWGPWRVRPWAELLRWLRSRRTASADRPRVVGTTPAIARPRDTVTVLEAVGALDTPVRDHVAALLRTIAQAHASGEHALRAQGEVSGPPFVDLAREVQAAVDPVATAEVRTAMARIVELHATSISAGADPWAHDEETGRRIVREHVDAGRRVVILDGVGHLNDPDRGMGAWLRRLIGEGYRTVPITFGSGRIRDIALPAPADDTLDGLLDTLPGDGILHVDRVDAAGRRALRAVSTVRLVSGMYRVEEDARHRYPSGGLIDSSAIVHVRTVTPVEPL